MNDYIRHHPRLRDLSIILQGILKSIVFAVHIIVGKQLLKIQTKTEGERFLRNTACPKFKQQFVFLKQLCEGIRHNGNYFICCHL